MSGKIVSWFAGGVLFGTAGLRLLTSRDARTLYAHCTAAVLRMKDDVMNTVTSVQEGAQDIYADAKEINARRAAENVVVEDAAMA
ncbi:MAG: hypothetical protein IJ112_07050 [Oscillospiraceae bacterium]|nr:hypothetical protein [Oscillospiraceae bacterium]